MDNTFGSKGVVVTDFAATSAGYDSFDRSTAVTVQSDGKIVSAGSVSGSVDGVGVAAYQGGLARRAGGGDSARVFG